MLLVIQWDDVVTHTKIDVDRFIWGAARNNGTQVQAAKPYHWKNEKDTNTQWKDIEYWQTLLVVGFPLPLIIIIS